MNNLVADKSKQRRRRYRLLYKLEASLEAPMFLLALLWLVFLVIELTQGLSQTQEHIVTAIWVLFIFEFVLKLFLAPRKLAYIKQNWITLLALVIPAFRAFRLLRAIRLLRATRVASTTKFVRALTSTKRFISDVQEAQGPAPTPEMNVGILVAHTQALDKEGMQGFIDQLTRDVQQEMQQAMGLQWNFHVTEPSVLTSDSPRRPSDFLEDASLRMAEGPYDLVVVLTDVALMSRRKRVEAGLASPVSRVLVISTRKLVTAPRGRPMRSITSEAVRWNGGALLLHLLGHVVGLRHRELDNSHIMKPFEFREDRTALPRFTPAEQALLRKRGERMPERELRGGNVMESLIFHVLMALRHPMDVLRPLLRNWAPLLPLSLPGLATAAVAPSVLLVFSAEMWDVGLNMPNRTVIIFTIISILAASFYLVQVQSLFLPREEKRVLTEHLAVANTVIFLSILLACIGLFVLVGGLMLLTELYIFPEGLMKTWPTLLDQPKINLTAKIRLAAFISTLGVLTGALAGGLESRTVIQHLALFQDKP
ncbi:hypothetical protein [Botryobacter ruber]|uniref:hypothetical protein n=1 Tax=Botryobacter ruber TaxID=2171629 RepID=UPI000E0C6C22|nr:hypothetical protein [Botryobacter ruber]